MRPWPTSNTTPRGCGSFAFSPLFFACLSVCFVRLLLAGLSTIVVLELAHVFGVNPKRIVDGSGRAGCRHGHLRATFARRVLLRARDWGPVVARDRYIDCPRRACRILPIDWRLRVSPLALPYTRGNVPDKTQRCVEKSSHAILCGHGVVLGAGCSSPSGIEQNWRNTVFSRQAGEMRKRKEGRCRVGTYSSTSASLRVCVVSSQGLR